MASRYAAVFPLSELINWVYHTRGQRYEELPHSYQMMLFWAGLRGAVGVALAAGITGDNADALRTTILVVVVLTVIVFGGTTSRMMEVLGIRTGVEDEDASSDEDEAWTSRHGGLALQMGPGSRRYVNGVTRPYENPHAIGSELDLHSPVEPHSYFPSTSRRPPLQNSTSRSGFSTDDSDDAEPLGGDDIEAPPGHVSPSKPGMIFRDGQWFTALDERYLLPLFSNSVTARRAASKKAKRAVHSGGGESGSGTPRGVSMDIARDGGNGAGDEVEVESENGKNKLPRTFR